MWFSAFRGAVRHEVHERIEGGRRYIGIAGQIVSNVEQGVRIPLLLSPRHAEVRKRIDPCILKEKA